MHSLLGHAPGRTARPVNGRSPIENGFKTGIHRFSSIGYRNTATNGSLRTVLRSELWMPVFRPVANAVYWAFLCGTLKKFHNRKTNFHFLSCPLFARSHRSNYLETIFRLEMNADRTSVTSVIYVSVGKRQNYRDFLI